MQRLTGLVTTGELTYRQPTKSKVSNNASLLVNNKRPTFKSLIYVAATAFMRKPPSKSIANTMIPEHNHQAAEKLPVLSKIAPVTV